MMNSAHMLAITIYYFCVLENYEAFEEEMLIKDLGNGFSLFTFNFITEKHNIENDHFEEFPRRIYDIYNKHNVNEFQLSFVRGYWDSVNWGSPPSYFAPGGAEIYAWFKSSNNTDTDFLWKSLLLDLSGKFCASIDSLAKKSKFTSPKWSYRPQGLAANYKDSMLRFAKLPTEVLCTENLTPWLKLLPCKNKLGLASILHSTMLYKSSYLSMSVRVDKSCGDPNCKKIRLVHRQTLSVVFDRRIFESLPTSKYSLQGYFGRMDFEQCPIASSSMISILSSPTNAAYEIVYRNDVNSNDVLPYNSEKVVIKSLKSESVRNIIIKPSVLKSSLSHNPLPLMIEKYLTGVGDIEGGIRTAITSFSDENIKFVYYDVLPWTMTFYSSSLRILCTKGSETFTVNPLASSVILGKANTRMSSIELQLEIPAHSVLIIEYKFAKKLKQWNRYPPDANHGFYVPSATISFYVPKSHTSRMKTFDTSLNIPPGFHTYKKYLSSLPQERLFVRLFSTNVLVKMPVPDFSMPFNALCLVCSVIAVLFSSIHKATVTRFVLKSASAPQTIKERVLHFIFK